MRSFATFILAAVLFSSCTREPEAIHFGKDLCHHCKMTIIDNKFGAEIVTAKGKIFKFDAVECLRDYYGKEYKNTASEDDLYLTVDYNSPGNFIDATNATFLNDAEIKSPMGGNLAAFSTTQFAEQQLKSAEGKILTWKDLLKTN